MRKFLLPACLSIALTMFLAFQGHTQDQSADSSAREHYKFGIGAGAGFTTGYGLSFRYMPNRIGGQINFAPYKDQDRETYSVGLTFLYNLVEGKKTNLYLYQANHYFYNNERSYYYYDPYFNQSYESDRIKESYVNNGIGFGVEIIILKRIGFNLMTGYAAYENFERLSLSVESALYYKF